MSIFRCAHQKRPTTDQLIVKLTLYTLLVDAERGLSLPVSPTRVRSSTHTHTLVAGQVVRSRSPAVCWADRSCSCSPKIVCPEARLSWTQTSIDFCCTEAGARSTHSLLHDPITLQGQRGHRPPKACYMHYAYFLHLLGPTPKFALHLCIPLWLPYMYVVRWVLW